MQNPRPVCSVFLIQSRLRQGSNAGKQHPISFPISNPLPQPPQHSPPSICHSPGPRHSRRSSPSPARARTEGRTDEMAMAPGRGRVAGGRLERETRAQRSRRGGKSSGCPCRGRDPPGGRQASRLPANLQFNATEAHCPAGLRRRNAGSRDPRDQRGEGKLDATHRPTRLQTRNAGSPVPLSGSSHSINPPFASQAVGSRLKPCLIK